MADDAAAPDGELTDSTATKSTKTEETESDASRATGGDDDDDDDIDDIDDVADDDIDDIDDMDDMEAIAPKPPMSHVRLATIAGLVVVVALAGLTGWLGFRTYESHKADEQRKLFLQVGRQGALNLTTIDWQQADADVQRILDSATGTFYDDFQKRAQPFIEVVKQAQSKSVGTIAEAGLESESGRRSPGACRGDGQDDRMPVPRTAATRVADADHGGEGRRRGQGVQRGVRSVSRHSAKTRR